MARASRASAGDRSIRRRSALISGSGVPMRSTQESKSSSSPQRSMHAPASGRPPRTSPATPRRGDPGRGRDREAPRWRLESVAAGGFRSHRIHQQKGAAGAEHPHHLGQGPFGGGIVVRAESRGHHVEARIRKGELLHVSQAKRRRFRSRARRPGGGPRPAWPRRDRPRPPPPRAAQRRERCARRRSPGRAPAPHRCARRAPPCDRARDRSPSPGGWRSWRPPRRTASRRIALTSIRQLLTLRYY